MVKGERKGHRRAGSNADSIPISISAYSLYVRRDARATAGQLYLVMWSTRITVSTENSESMQKSSDLSCPSRCVTGMVAFVSALLSWRAGRFRSRAELELKSFAPPHQLAVLHR